jgi:hypothetical protein
MNLIHRFLRLLDEDPPWAPGSPAGLPVRLTRAVAAVLPVDGVGLSMQLGTSSIRPLAASDPDVAVAESLQFTVGGGPDVIAIGTGLPMPGTERLLARRWPAFHDLLVTQTLLRSILAVPLPGSRDVLGAMTFYFVDPVGPLSVDLRESEQIAELVAGHLRPAVEWAAREPTAPAWMRTPAARRRDRLWMAVGMLTLLLQVSASEALTLLRARAYAMGRTADDLAERVLEGRVDPYELRRDS